VGYEEGRSGPCGAADPLRNGKRNNARARRAACGGAPATPEVIVPTGEKVTVKMRESKKEETTVADVENLDLLAT
jgi:hypothetical protein